MKTITATELKNRMEHGEILLVDVREPAEHRSECIEGSYLIPLAEISAEKLPIKSCPIVLHCRSGKRSEEACRKLLAEDPTHDIFSLEGGIVAWKKSGYAVSNLGCHVLPLDRQTQLAAGFLVTLGIALGTWVTPSFYVLSGFVGLGLMFAGISGWCGMAKLLAKMPWNR